MHERNTDDSQKRMNVQAMTQENLKLLCVLAHPDDETLGCGGTLARYAAQGIETYVITATRGQQGWLGDAQDDPGHRALGEVRERELREAAAALQVKELTLLNYMDGDLSTADRGQIISELTEQIRRIRPQVVITFDPFGAYGHPDHIAICQYTATAVVCAADANYQLTTDLAPFSISKFYFLVTTQPIFELYEQVFGRLVMQVNGHSRQSVPWPAWSVTTRIDISPYRDAIWQAVLCHQSQMLANRNFLALSTQHRDQLWAHEDYYRVFSRVNIDIPIEDDLFTGLYKPAT